MKKHIQSVHKKIKELSCDTCERTFGRRYLLKIHIKILHEKIKEFECDDCGKTRQQGDNRVI